MYPGAWLALPLTLHPLGPCCAMARSLFLNSPYAKTPV